MGWLIALAILVLLAILPLGASVIYDSAGALVRIIAGPLKLQVYPARKKKGGKPRKEKKKKAPSREKAPAGEPVEKTPAPKAPDTASSKPKPKGGPITDFLPLVQVILDLLLDFRRKLRINRLEMNLILGGGDPCDLAVNYGKAWAALGNLWPRLEELFVIQKRDVRIQCDFEASQTLVTARLDLTITLGRLLSMGVRHGIRTLIELMKITNKRKGGAAL